MELTPTLTSVCVCSGFRIPFDRRSFFLLLFVLQNISGDRLTLYLWMFIDRSTAAESRKNWKRKRVCAIENIGCDRVSACARRRRAFVRSRGHSNKLKSFRALLFLDVMKWNSPWNGYPLKMGRILIEFDPDTSMFIEFCINCHDAIHVDRNISQANWKFENFRLFFFLFCFISGGSLHTFLYDRRAARRAQKSVFNSHSDFSIHTKWRYV